MTAAPTKNSLSDKGREFLAKHEGFVSTAYLCPAGVLTIGYGFTMGSKVFAQYWRQRHGRALRKGDKIGRMEAETLLHRVFDSEYGAAVNREIRPALQQHYDGAGSVAFNCGNGSLKWKWALALARGDIVDATDRLRTTAVTANGRRLAGLVRRRAEEAALIRFGRYAGLVAEAPSSSAVSETVAEIREYQAQLLALGYQLGKADGIAGSKTLAAVKAFQKAQGLVADGIVGPATRATLLRALDAKRSVQATGGVGGLGAAAAAIPTDLAAQPLDAILPTLASGLGAAAVIAIVSFAIRYRGRITGRRVPT